MEVKEVLGSWKGEKEGGCDTQAPATLLAPVPGTGVSMVPFDSFRTHFDTVRFSFAISTLRTEFLLWQSSGFMELLGGFELPVDTLLEHTSSLSIKVVRML